MKIQKTIRDLESELYARAKAQAALEGKTIGQWISEAIAEKLLIHDAGKKGKKGSGN